MKIKEKSIHKDLVNLLRLYQKSKDFIFFHVKNDVGMRRGRFFFDLKPLGVLAGVSDFIFVKKNKVAFLEIKTVKGRLSPSQKEFLEGVASFGHEVHVAYGFDDAVKKINEILENNEDDSRNSSKK